MTNVFGARCMRTFLLTVLAATAVVCLASSAAAASEGNSTAHCSMYAAPSGSNNASGTATQPFATVQHLAEALGPGQTGCIRGGTYAENVKIAHGGSAGAPITLTSYPGERATIVGRFWIAEGSNYVTVEDLDLNGKNETKLPSPTINSHYASFIDNEITNEHTAICVAVGSSWGRAEHTLIEGNRIHDCGELPATNHQHGIYDGESLDTRIVDNVIFRNADRGIQLYPNAQETVIEHNIIVANGEDIIFSGVEGQASSNTVVRENLITNAVIRYDVESWYPAGNPMGTGNFVEDNCVWGGAKGTITDNGEGFSATDNMTANPEYADAEAGDYRVSTSSPCAALIANEPVPATAFGSSNGGDTYASGSSTSISTTTTSTTSPPPTSSETTTTTTTTTATTTSSSSSSSSKTRGGNTKGKRHQPQAHAAVVKLPRAVSLQASRKRRHHRRHKRTGTSRQVRRAVR